MLVSVIGSWMQMAAQGWLVLELTNSAFSLGLVAACAAFPTLVFSLPAGVVADRLKKRNILLVTQTLAMFQAFALAFLIYAGLVEVWHVMVLAAFLGTNNAFDMTTRHAMVIEVSSREDAFNAVSLNSTAFQVGRVVGPTVGGVLLGSIGFAGCFFVNGLTYLPMILALVMITPRPSREVSAQPMLRHIGEGIAWVRAQPVSRTLLAMMAVSSLFAMPYTTLLPVIAKDLFNKGPQAYGFMFSAPGLGALVAAVTLTAQSHRWPPGPLVTFGSLIFPVMLAGVAFSPSYGMVIAALILNGVGMMTFNVVANTMLQQAPPDALRGRVMSLRTFVFAGFTPFGNLQIGAMAQWMGPRVALALGAGVCFASALAAWWRVPALRQSR
jgi:MFS family permease